MAKYLDGIQQTQKTIAEQIIFNSLAIRNTISQTSVDIDVSDATKKSLTVLNTLNQTVTLGIQLNFNGVWNSAGQSQTVPIGTSYTIYDETFFKALSMPVKAIRVYVIATTAPTSGSISVTLTK